jgi:hypothetical protein
MPFQIGGFDVPGCYAVADRIRLWHTVTQRAEQTIVRLAANAHHDGVYTVNCSLCHGKNIAGEDSTIFNRSYLSMRSQNNILFQQPMVEEREVLADHISSVWRIRYATLAASPLRGGAES